MVIRGSSSIAYEPDEFPLVIGWLNRWHEDYRWPTASLQIGEDGARVVGSFQVYLAAGATDAQVVGFVGVGTETICQLHHWLAEQHQSARVRPRTLTVVELEEWFRRAA